MLFEVRKRAVLAERNDANCRSVPRSFSFQEVCSLHLFDLSFLLFFPKDYILNYIKNNKKK